MPKPLSDHEKQIGARLREFREGLFLTQSKFAEKCRLTRERMRLLESGKARLRWSEFLGIAGLFELSARWLATGEGNQTLPLEAANYPESIEPKRAFLQAFFEEAVPASRPEIQGMLLLASVSDAAEILRFEIERLLELPGDTSDDIGRSYSVERLAALFKRTVAALREEIRRGMERDAAKGASGKNVENRDEPEENQTGQKRNLTETLDGSVEIREKKRVSAHQWKTLKARLAALTGSYGGKSRLARKLGVSRQTVNAWISGSSEPGADMAFRLLEFVSQSEAKPQK